MKQEQTGLPPLVEKACPYSASMVLLASFESRSGEYDRIKSKASTRHSTIHVSLYLCHVEIMLIAGAHLGSWCNRRDHLSLSEEFLIKNEI